MDQFTQQNNEGNETRENHFMLPLAIIIAAIFISGAIFYSRGGLDFLKVDETATGEKNGSGRLINDTANDDLEKIRPVDSKDHIRGNASAFVKVVEYSDFECPFCKDFHSTMKQIISEYGESGKVAWIYRHFPIDELHPVKARKEAAASECAAELGGNDAFWKYADRIFEVTPSNNQLDLSLLPQLAQDIGLDKTKFEMCLESGKYGEHIEDDLENAVATGGSGTPWSVVIAPNGKKFPISGAQSYFTVKSIVELALKD